MFKTLSMTAVVLALCSSMAFAQSLEQKKQKKLASAFLKNGTWYTDFDKAKQAAYDEGKLIFTYFTRSYSP